MIYYSGFRFSTTFFYIANAILLIALIFIYYYSKRKKAINYFRELPTGLTTSLLSYYYKGKISNKTILLTLLDLINKGYYCIEKQGDDYLLKYLKKDLLNVDSFELKTFEKELLKFINLFIFENNGQDIKFSVLNEKIKNSLNVNNMSTRFYDSFKGEIKNGYGFINLQNNYTLILVISTIYSLLIFNPSDIFGFVILMAYMLLIISVATILRNVDLNFKGIISILFLIYIIAIISLPLFPTIMNEKNGILFLIAIANPFLIIVNVLIIKIVFKTTDKQKKVLNEIQGLKKFLTDFSNLKEKELGHINFYAYYYSAAIALDVKLENNPYVKMEYDDNSFETLTTIEFAEKISNIFSNIK